MQKIPMYIESEWGHGTEESPVKEVPAEKIADEVKGHLQDGKWATLQKKDGSTEVLTSKDAPPSDDWKQVFGGCKEIARKEHPAIKPSSTTTSKEFSKKFEKVTSVTVTKTVKGG